MRRVVFVGRSILRVPPTGHLPPVSGSWFPVRPGVRPDVLWRPAVFRYSQPVDVADPVAGSDSLP